GARGLGGVASARRGRLRQLPRRRGGRGPRGRLRRAARTTPGAEGPLGPRQRVPFQRQHPTEWRRQAMTVLVVGATGNAGSSVVRELRSHGVATRAFVRDPGRARALLGEDVELAAGDLGDPASLTRALDGVERLFLACGNVPGQVELESNAIEAARAAGVRLVVKLSAAAASPDSPLLFPRWQGEIEQRLRASGLPWVLLRPTSYMTNLFLSAQAVRATGKLLAPAGAARISMIDPRDVGAVGAAVLAGEGHDGAAYLLSGPAAITYADVAAALSEATGRTIEFVDVPDEAA